MDRVVQPTPARLSSSINDFGGLRLPCRRSSPGYPRRLDDEIGNVESHSPTSQHISSDSIHARTSRTSSSSSLQLFLPQTNFTRSTPNEYVDDPSSSSDINKRNTSQPELNSLPQLTYIHDSKNDKPPEVTTDRDHHPFRESIVCRRCGKCRCSKCTETQTPVCWCGQCDQCWCGQCECSPDKLVDYCSGLWCVQNTILSRCTNENNDDHILRDDDSCCQSRRCLRWTILAAIVPCLPCLLLYWPLHGLVCACRTCYSRCRRPGCRCRPDPSNALLLTTITEKKEAQDST